MRRSLICVLFLVGATACGDDQRTSPVDLTAGNGCGDAFFWAATESGDVAVTFTIEAKNRSQTEATTVEFELPDNAVTVEVLEGRNLSRNFCTDLLDGASEPRATQRAVAGSGTIMLEPMPAEHNSLSCGSVHGELEMSGLEAEDGTTFTPVRVASNSIGCYAG